MQSFGKTRKKKKKNNRPNKKGEGHLSNLETDLSSISGDSISTDISGSMDDIQGIIQQADVNLKQQLTKNSTRQKTQKVRENIQNDFQGFKLIQKDSLSSDKAMQRSGTHTINKKVDYSVVPEYIRFLYIQSTEENVDLKKIHPFGLKKGIELITDGPIKSAKFCRSGSLLIETYNYNQTKKFAVAKTLINKTIQIKVTPAYNINTTQGTIYAPELENLSNDEIAEGLHTKGNICKKNSKRQRKISNKCNSFDFWYVGYPTADILWILIT
ncbi:UNVERIFIED_CONTAM: hypothetical protein RMT77_011044 [Armadillidium vulgare]